MLVVGTPLKLFSPFRTRNFIANPMGTRVVLTISFLANLNFTIICYAYDFRSDERNLSRFFPNDNSFPVLLFLAAFKPQRFRT